MSSTYSTNLAIELIGSGEQAGTWGTTTNTNLGTLIEQAISGIVTQAITDGADTTITIPNGASGVARNMVIECTGALTAARNLIVPTNKKLYFIYNNTTGGYAVTVKVSGQTGVSVPNGAKVILMMNSAGTDIVSATNYQAALTLGSALPVASGGTGATSITSGSLVKGNGTSAFSAASSSDIATALGSTNISGNAANVTGTVAVANGGTGSTTAAGALTNLGAYAASNPSGYTNNTGTVTSVATGNGLSGGTITSTGTLAIACPTFASVGSYVGGSTTSNNASGTTKTLGGTYSCWAISYSSPACGMIYTAQPGTWMYMGACFSYSNTSSDAALMCRIA